MEFIFVSKEPPAEQPKNTAPEIDALIERIDAHLRYLQSSWAVENPVVPDSTYDLLRDAVIALKESKDKKSD